jgi:galactose oxidase
MITGGSNSAVTSIYDPKTDSWSRSGDLNRARGYHSMTLTAGGTPFTLGGSWSGGLGGKDGERFDNGRWSLLSGIKAEGSLLTRCV